MNSNQSAITGVLKKHLFSDHELPYGQYFFKDWIFTPFKENSEDYEELDGLVEEYEVKKIVQGKEMDFICIFYSYGYPDHFFVCTTDPDQNNPAVYSTHHEMYFRKLRMEKNRKSFWIVYDPRRFLRNRYRVIGRENCRIRDSQVVNDSISGL